VDPDSVGLARLIPRLAAQLALAGLALIPSASSAQDAPTCEQASARVTGRALPPVGSPEWNNWVTLTGCGSRGATVIAGALRSGPILRETELGRLDHLAGLLDGWFQPSLVAAYQDLVRSGEASTSVRLRAMWLLAGLYAPEVEVAGPLQNFSATGCQTYQRNTSLREAPPSLPKGVYDEAVSAFYAAESDPGASERVRSTARCWAEVVRNQAAQVTDAAESPASPAAVVVEEPAQAVFVEEPIRVRYDCGTRFVFYNDFGYDVAVHYAVVGAGHAGVLRVRHGGPFVFAAAHFGPMRFWVGEREIAYFSVAYRPCQSRVLIVGAPVYPWYGWDVGLGVVAWPRHVVTRFVGPRYVAPRYVPPRHVPARPVPRDVPSRPEPRHAVPVVSPPLRRDDRPVEPRRPAPGPRYEAPRWGPFPAAVPRPSQGQERRERVAVPRGGSGGGDRAVSGDRGNRGGRDGERPGGGGRGRSGR
jgi:hypothetical protein